jgi:hypothetical protein
VRNTKKNCKKSKENNEKKRRKEGMKEKIITRG